MPMPRNWLATLRTRRGLSQQALAELLGVSARTVSRWETGVEDPPRPRAIALDALLGGASHRVLTELLREMRAESASLRRAS